MADNYTVLDSTGATKTKAAQDLGSGVLADEVVGNVAAGAANAGNPLGNGLAAYNPDVPPAAVDSGDRQFVMGDLYGRPVVYLGTTLSNLIDSIQANSGPSINAQTNWAICQATNSTTAGTTFAALAPTATAPTASSTRCVITWTGRDNLVLMPFAVGADNVTSKMRVTGWSTDGTNWYPTCLFDCTMTASTITGISGQTPDNTNRFADTIAAGIGTGLVIASPADNAGVATVLVPIGNYQRVEVQFILNGSATSVNALYTSY